MPRYKLTVEYHGGPFVGWQKQVTGRSVQGAIEAALRKLEPDAPAIQGAGRTDAGVHATGQVAHCDMRQEWSAFRLAGAVNHHLKPNPIAIVAAERVEDGFHARFDATSRSYLYRIISRRAPLTHDRGLVWRVNEALDPDAMRAAAQTLVGKHDFTTFRSVNCQAQSAVKTLDRFDVISAGTEMQFVLRARSFLHNQVRSFVGTLVQVGHGRWPVEQVREALMARDRAACGPVAPPEGLYLTSVAYPETG